MLFRRQRVVDPEELTLNICIFFILFLGAKAGAARQCTRYHSRRVVSTSNSPSLVGARARKPRDARSTNCEHKTDVAQRSIMFRILAP